MRIVFAILAFLSAPSYSTAQTFHDIGLLQYSELTENLFGPGNRTAHTQWHLVYHVLDREGQVSASLKINEDSYDLEACLRDLEADQSHDLAACRVNCSPCQAELITRSGAIGFRIVEIRPNSLLGTSWLFRDGSILEVSCASPRIENIESCFGTLLEFADDYILQVAE